MKLGIDIDGCLADFNSSFIEKLIEVTSEDKFPPRPFEITAWDYPQLYGYTEEEISKVWDEIMKDDKFWWRLKPYVDAFYAMERITELWEQKNDIYFITSRPGIEAKLQTEAWLINFGTGILPTVLISGHKGTCAHALKLDFYIDDRTENCEDVRRNSLANVIMLAQPWNKDVVGIPRIPTWRDFFEAVKESSEWLT